ncbi:hypothetical protein RSOLAG1IB_04181 [Rhizoctonia solani AG-1 IB]|uniref:Uncharacterized protein n=1 Tax=Thanatephorus cucumeris (strain AG1-IB / isolate 7/3/14) TaxID=1108050 RepID=A0A0B7FXL5_THACB|nr:hypothetical protein RSOLAG1IB_04181 [Rhizoctonia solani AG-1 IB]
MLDQTWQVDSSARAPLPDLERGMAITGMAPGNTSWMPQQPPTPIWPANWPTSGPEVTISRPIKVARDMQTITTKGFRTLGLASTFITGVQAQFYSIVTTIDAQDNVILQASSGCLLVGILLSASGAIAAFLSSRWFELLNPEEVGWLEHRWAYARRETDKAIPWGQSSISRYRIRNRFVAKSLMMPFYMILFGCLLFVIGVILYTWTTQPRAISIACTVVMGLCGFVILGMYLKFEARGVLSHTNFTRVRL